MGEPNAWKKLTRWQRWMISLNDRFNGNTERIIEHLAKERGWEWPQRQLIVSYHEVEEDRDETLETQSQWLSLEGER